MATLRSEEYWEARAAARMDVLQADAEQTLAKLGRAYRAAQGSMSVQIRAMTRTFAKRYGLTEAEAAEILKKPASRESLSALKKAVADMPEGREKQKMLAELNAPSARYRISNTQAIRQQAQAVCSRIADEEMRLFTDSLTKSISESYMRTAYDIQMGLGISWRTTGVSNRVVNQLLREDWSGANYRTRIMGRYSDLAREMSDLMLEGLLGGRSREQMIEEMQQRFAMDARDARRLLVTETTYVVNAAELERYKEWGRKKYIYLAVLDLKTSDICQTLDGMVFDVKYAKAGRNFPPMHPNCRSTTAPVIGKKELDEFTRKATDPVTGEVMTLPPGTTYRDWYKMVTASDGTQQRKATPNVASASPRFLNRMDKLYSNAQKVKPINGYSDVVVHGDKFGFLYVDADGKESNVSAVEFADILKKTPSYGGGPIRLLSCETAAEGAITAQALADELGVDVMAPTDTLFVDEDGGFVIGPDQWTNSGKWVIIKPRERRK